MVWADNEAPCQFCALIPTINVTTADQGQPNKFNSGINALCKLQYHDLHQQRGRYRSPPWRVRLYVTLCNGLCNPYALSATTGPLNVQRKSLSAMTTDDAALSSVVQLTPEPFEQMESHLVVEQQLRQHAEKLQADFKRRRFARLASLTPRY